MMDNKIIIVGARRSGKSVAQAAMKKILLNSGYNVVDAKQTEFQQWSTKTAEEIRQDIQHCIDEYARQLQAEIDRLNGKSPESILESIVFNEVDPVQNVGPEPARSGIKGKNVAQWKQEVNRGRRVK